MKNAKNQGRVKEKRLIGETTTIAMKTTEIHMMILKTSLGKFKGKHGPDHQGKEWGKEIDIQIIQPGLVIHSGSGYQYRQFKDHGHPHCHQQAEE